MALFAGIVVAGRSRWTREPEPRSSPVRCCSRAWASARSPPSWARSRSPPVPDERSAEVGGLQNTVTNLGASMGTALAGSILIATLTASFLQGVSNNPRRTR